MHVANQKITPYLWFVDNNAEEAIQYYCEVFPNSKIIEIARYPEDESVDEHFKGMKGKVLTGVFELDGQQFMAIDGGDHGFTFNSAVSFLVECNDQKEIDYYWEKLSAKPEDEQCGWCTDKHGVLWQIVPKDIDNLMDTPAKIQAMMQMKKIDISALESA